MGRRNYLALIVAAVVAGVVLTSSRAAPAVGTVSLFGQVVDAETKEPVPGVQVTVDGRTGVTNSDGEYTIVGLIPGTYLITFRLEGYIPVAFQRNLFEGLNELRV